VAQTRRVRIVLTGFEPFAGRGVNPSWEAAQQLQGAPAGPARIDVLRVPVVWRESVATIARELEREPADGLVIGGLSFGRPAISVEAIAHAIGDVPWQADNADRALSAARSDDD
jgi:pyroglutamyl-peptidase